MNKYLIIFTSHYPYGRGEEFLETEIEYLSPVFEKIIIINNKRHGKKRKLPGNVTVKTIDYNSMSITKLDKCKSLFMGESLYMTVKSYLRNKNFNGLYSRIMKNMRINAKYNYYIEEIIKYLQYEQMILDQCIFYSYWFSHNAVAIYLLKKYFKSIKIVSRAHSTDIYEWNLRWQSLFPLYNISRKMDKIFFISDHARKYFLNMKNNLLIDNTIVSRLGVKEFRSIGIMKNRETLRIVSVSNIISLKRIDLIIDALAVTNEKIEWRHIGEGMQSADIKEYAHEKLSGINNVKYKFGGYVPNKKLNQYYINYKPHVLINTTKREGIPVTIMEIMSYGIPVIAMNAGATIEIVTDRNGVLLKEDSEPSDIAAAISYIKNLSGDEYERMCRNARKTFLERYSADNNYKKFIDRLIQL